MRPCASRSERGVAAEQGSRFVSASHLQMEIGFIFMAGSSFLKVAPASSLSSWLCQKTALGGLKPPENSPNQGRVFSVPSPNPRCA